MVRQSERKMYENILDINGFVSEYYSLVFYFPVFDVLENCIPQFNRSQFYSPEFYTSGIDGLKIYIPDFRFHKIIFLIILAPYLCTIKYWNMTHYITGR